MAEGNDKDRLATSRIELTADSQSVEAGVNRAKKSVQSLVVETEKMSAKQEAANKRAAASFDAQIKKIGLTTEQRLRNNIVEKTGGEIQAKLLKQLDERLAKMVRANTLGADTRAAANIELENRALEKQNAIRDRLATLAASERGKRILDAQNAPMVGNQPRQISEGQRRLAAIQTPQQIQDFVIQVQGGQNPLVALLQQGSQLQGLYGSVGAAIKGVGSAVASIVTPVTVSVGAVAALAVAAYQGSTETTKLNAALIKSGGIAGETASSLANYADSLGEIQGVTVGKAVSVLAQLAETGEFTGEQMQLAAEAALKWQVATGTAVEDTVGQFKKLAQDPVAALIELNKNMGLVTESQIQAVQAFAQAGQMTDAATLAIKVYSETLENRSKAVVENLGYIDRAWNAVTSSVSKAWDALKSIGREDTAAEKIKDLTSKMEVYQRAAKTSTSTGAKEFYTRESEKLKAQVTALQNVAKVKLIDGSSVSQEARRASKANADLREQNLKAEESAALSSKNLETRLQAVKTSLVRKGVTDRAAIERAVQLETDKFNQQNATKASGGGRSSSGDGGLGSAKLAAIKAEATAEKDVLAQQTSDLKAQYDAREISARNYYEKLRELSAQGTAIEAASIQKQIDELSKQTGARQKSGAIAVQIASLQAQAAKLQEESAAKISRINAEEEAAAKKRADGLRAYKQALQETTMSMQADFDSRVKSIGMGTKQFEIESKLNAVLSDKAKRLREIALAEQSGNLDSESATANRSAIEEEAAAQIQVIKDGYAELDAAQKDGLNGLTAGLQDYIDQAGNVAGSVKSAVGTVAGALEDVFVNMATKSKTSFKDMADSIIADLVRIAAKQAVTGLFSNVLGAIGGGGASSAVAGAITGFASGGYTGAGSVNQPAGVVHKGEVVWSQTDVAKAGGVGAVEAMRLGRKGYAAGGVVGMSGAVAKQGAPNVNVTVVGGEGGATAESSINDKGDLDITVFLGQAEKYIAGNIASGRSPVTSALKGRLNVSERKG